MSVLHQEARPGLLPWGAIANRGTNRIFEYSCYQANRIPKGQSINRKISTGVVSPGDKLLTKAPHDGLAVVSMVRQISWRRHSNSMASNDEKQYGTTGLDLSGLCRNTSTPFGKWGPPPSKQCRRHQSCAQAVCFMDNTAISDPSFTDASVSCTTFNILAPIYKRINGEECRESQFRDDWLNRNQSIVDMLLWKDSSIICLQEFWLGSEELVKLYEENLGNAGYDMYKLPRTNNRGDGLFTAIKKERLTVLDYQELLFNDCGDRVAQFLRLRFNNNKDQPGGLQEMLLVNTHLLFPHNSNYCLVRLRQVYKILKYLEQYKSDHNLPPIPIVLCGDWNGSKRGQVYKFLRSQGFISSYDAAHQYTDSDADAHRWVSHRNHRGNICGVDFIWLLKPNKQQRSLSECWKAAVFGIIKAKLHEVGLKEKDAFQFFKARCDECVLYQDCTLSKLNEYLTYQDFHRAIIRLGLTAEDLEGLKEEEIKDLILTADCDGNGIIDYDEFVGILYQSLQQEKEESKGRAITFEKIISSHDCSRHCGTLHKPSDIAKHNFIDKPRDLVDMWSLPIDNEGSVAPSNDWAAELDVQEATLYPPEVEQGTWPENYYLSDHAPLTAIFTPVYGAKGDPTSLN